MSSQPGGLRLKQSDVKEQRVYYVGIDIGASSVKVAAVDAAGAVVRVLRRAHQGSPRPCLRALRSWKWRVLRRAVGSQGSRIRRACAG